MHGNVSTCSSCWFWMSMWHAVPSLAITLVLSTLMSRLYLRLTRSRQSTSSYIVLPPNGQQDHVISVAKVRNYSPLIRSPPWNPSRISRITISARRRIYRPGEYCRPEICSVVGYFVIFMFTSVRMDFLNVKCQTLNVGPNLMDVITIRSVICLWRSWFGHRRDAVPPLITLTIANIVTYAFVKQMLCVFVGWGSDRLEMTLRICTYRLPTRNGDIRYNQCHIH